MDQNKSRKKDDYMRLSPYIKSIRGKIIPKQDMVLNAGAGISRNSKRETTQSQESKNTGSDMENSNSRNRSTMLGNPYMSENNNTSPNTVSIYKKGIKLQKDVLFHRRKVTIYIYIYIYKELEDRDERDRGNLHGESGKGAPALSERGEDFQEHSLQYPGLPQ